MQSHPRTLVVIGTGGTIAGTADRARDNVGYKAAQLRVEQLLETLPSASTVVLETEQLAQVDSKDMDHALWQALAQRVAHHLAQESVAGIVITHGTDTLEETAYWLHRVLAPAKPVVLTAAMRPANALLADGPQNLSDALTVACLPDARGVLVVMANNVFEAVGLRKAHSYRIDAFSAGDAGPLARIEEGRLRQFRPWPAVRDSRPDAIHRPLQAWPRVEIVFSHAGAGAMLVDALLAQPLHGLVVAGTGNGSVHVALETALRRAAAVGVVVWRSSRCAGGGVIGGDADDLPSAGPLTPVQARIELMLELLAATT